MRSNYSHLLRTRLEANLKRKTTIYSTNRIINKTVNFFNCTVHSKTQNVNNNAPRLLWLFLDISKLIGMLEGAGIFSSYRPNRLPAFQKLIKQPTTTPYAWWRHQMTTFSVLLAICEGNSPSPVNSPHKGQWRGALIFSLICAWING